jgi:TPP-dependent pyruvate/acetoin dehydrogenase alpha subunit
MEDAVAAETQAAVQFAYDSPEPELSVALADVYAE